MSSVYNPTNTADAPLRESRYTLTVPAVPDEPATNGNASAWPEAVLSASDSIDWSPNRTGDAALATPAQTAARRMLTNSTIADDEDARRMLDLARLTDLLGRIRPRWVRLSATAWVAGRKDKHDR